MQYTLEQQISMAVDALRKYHCTNALDRFQNAAMEFGNIQDMNRFLERDKALLSLISKCRNPSKDEVINDLPIEQRSFFRNAA